MGTNKEGEKIKGDDIQEAETIGRAYTVSPREGGYDNAWHHTIEEAAVSATPQSLRFLLAIIIT